MKLIYAIAFARGCLGEDIAGVDPRLAVGGEKPFELRTEQGEGGLEKPLSPSKDHFCPHLGVTA